MPRTFNKKKLTAVKLVREWGKKGGGKSWHFLPYFANFTVVGSCCKLQTLSCLCKLAGYDPSPAEGNGRSPVDWGRARLCSKPVCFPPLVTANPRGSTTDCCGLEPGSLGALERQGGAWCLAVLAGCAWDGKRQHGCVPAGFEGTESAIRHGRLSCCALSTESFIERQNIQFSYDCCSAIQVDLVSPTWADHNFKLGIAWKLEEWISSNCQATSLFLCIHKH